MTADLETEYISRDDESEAARVQNISGIGEISYLTDDDVRGYSLNDFGMGLSEIPDRR